MSGVVARVLLCTVIAVSPSAIFAQRMASAVQLSHLAPSTVDTARAFQDRRISDGSRFGAILVSSMVGLGLGHKVMGFTDVGRAFLMTQGAGVGLAVAAFGLGEAGEFVFFGGAALYIGSRVWEFADVVIRPAAHNARIDAADKSRPPRGSQARISPVIKRGQQGLAVSISF